MRLTNEIINKANDMMVKGHRRPNRNVEYRDGVFYINVICGDSRISNTVTIEQMNEAFGKEFSKYTHGEKL